MVFPSQQMTVVTMMTKMIIVVVMVLAPSSFSSVSEDPCGKLIFYFSLIDALVLCFIKTTSANGSLYNNRSSTMTISVYQILKYLMFMKILY